MFFLFFYELHSFSLLKIFVYSLCRLIAAKKLVISLGICLMIARQDNKKETRLGTDGTVRVKDMSQSLFRKKMSDYSLLSRV